MSCYQQQRWDMKSNGPFATLPASQSVSPPQALYIEEQLACQTETKPCDTNVGIMTEVMSQKHDIAQNI